MLIKMCAFYPLAFTGIVQTNRKYMKHIYWNICFGLGYVHFFSMQTLSLTTRFNADFIFELHVEYFCNVCYETLGDLFDILVLRVLPSELAPFLWWSLNFHVEDAKDKDTYGHSPGESIITAETWFFRHLCRVVV